MDSEIGSDSLVFVSLQMLATTFDPSLGGRSFDLAIAHQLAKGFNKAGSDISKNKRAWIRLLAEVSSQPILRLMLMTVL